MMLRPLTFLAAMALGTAAYAENYVIDPTHTEVGFAWNHAGLTTQRGEWTGVAGSVDFDPTNVAATQINVEIDVASIHTGVADLDGHLKSADFFDAGAHPTITFTSTSAVQTGADTMRLIGDLTVKGQSSPVTLDATLTFMGTHPLGGFFDYYKGDWVGVEATGTVMRTALGVGKFAPGTSDAVELTISAEMRAGGWPQ